MKRLRTVALVARQAGLIVLNDALLEHPSIELVSVYTHAKLPNAEGGGRRPEAALFENACKTAGVPLAFLDFPEAKHLELHLPAGNIDLVVAVSWRFLVSTSVLDRLRFGALNLHRGALPEYAGAEPIRRAIEAGERRVAITAHRMTSDIDGGPIVSVVWMDINPLPPGGDSYAYAEEIKKRLEPLYAPLVRTAIAAIVA